MRTSQHVHLILKAKPSELRVAKFRDVEHLVVPVIGLVEGVLWPANADAPQLALASEFGKTPESWNGRPAVAGHPKVDGEYVAANSPEVLEATSFGQIFHAKLVNNCLVLEAWLNPAQAAVVGYEAENVIERIKNGQPVEVSVGVLVAHEEAPGVFNGKPYETIWRDVMPEHFAFLAEGLTGACSNEMGCGVLATAKLHALSANGVEVVDRPAELEVARNISTKERNKLPASDFAGPNRSFPIARPADVAAAVRAIGRAKGGAAARARIKARIISIAYRKGPLFVAQLPPDWKRKKDQQNAEDGMNKSVLDRLRNMLSVIVGQSGTSRNEVNAALYKSLRDKEPALSGIVDWWDDVVVFEVYEGNGSGYCMYERSYSINDGVAEIGDTRTKVEPVLTYEPVAAEAATEATTKNTTETVQVPALSTTPTSTTTPVAAAAHDCSCGGSGHQQQVTPAAAQQTQGDQPMKTKAERIQALLDSPHNPFKDRAALEASGEDGLAALEAHCATAAAAAPAATTTTAPAAAATSTTPTAAAAATTPAAQATTSTQAAQSTTSEAPKQKTAAEWLAEAPADVQVMFKGLMTAAASRRSALVAHLKVAQKAYSEAELQALPTDQLEKLAEITNVPVIPTGVDYSLHGAPVVNAGNNDIPDPPSLNARVLEINRAGRQSAA